MDLENTEAVAETPKPTTQVVNTTARLLWPPPRPGEKSIMLPPGCTAVETDLVEFWDSLPTKKGPGKIWAQWLALGWVKIDDLAPLGIAPPTNLNGYSEKGALALVNVETSPEALTRWAASRYSPAVTAACNARLASLAASPEAS